MTASSVKCAAPASVTPITMDAWLPFERAAAGSGWLIAQVCERRVRERWSEIAQLSGAPEGLQRRIQLLCDRAQALIEGEHSRLYRAAKGQPVPWDTARAPLATLLAECERFVATADETIALVRGALETAKTLRTMELEFAESVPIAWKRWINSAGVVGASAERAQSREELDALNQSVAAGRARLSAWREELLAWLGAAQTLQGVHPPLAAAEHRYRLLLTLGAVDRRQLQLRNAAEIRRVAREQLRAHSRGPGVDTTLVEVARQFTESVVSREFSADEIAAYTSALAIAPSFE